jgi:hypothetical protein
MLFGPGIRTGRYFMMVVAVLTLIGFWILVRRVGNMWWAAASIWIIVFNPLNAKMFGRMLSQGLILCMLIWVLALALGEDKPTWQIILSAIIAGLMLMTRVNMLYVLPLLVLYIFWQHGWKNGSIAAVAGGTTVLIGHAIYWPGILRMWTHLPRAISPFFDNWRFPNSGVQNASTPVRIHLSSRLLSFFYAIRSHFAAVISVIVAVLLWPKKNAWKSISDFRSSVFILSLFVLGTLMHGWSALLRDYCVFCFSSYLSFFSFIGVLLLVLTTSSLRKQSPWWWLFVIVFVLLLLATGLGYSTFEFTGNSIYDFEIPGILVGSASEKSVPLGGVLQNRLGLDIVILRRLLPTVLGFGVGFFILTLSIGIWYLIKRKSIGSSTLKAPSIGYIFLLLFLSIGVLLSPTVIMKGVFDDVCDVDVIASYEAVGEQLSEIIPKGSTVYWAGYNSAAPLLYIQDVDIFPPQINAQYSYFIGGDPQVLYKQSFWNEQLARRWLQQEADYILVEEGYGVRWLREILITDNYVKLGWTSSKFSCLPNSRIIIFKRVQ